ncbi:MAG: hypothetical protein WCK46_00320 [Candidatus Adlerbacteria bacterium]
MNTQRKNNRWAHVAATVLVGLLALFLVVSANAGLSRSLARTTATFFVWYCAQKPDSAGCYERTVPRLLYVVPVTDVFSVIREIQTQDTSYRFCHVLAHNIGQDEVARDTGAWVSLMHKNPPDSVCSNGYIHGIIVGRFHAAELPPEQIDAIEPDLARACEPAADWSPTNLDKAMCYHGMGHVLTFITGADMPRAVSYCKKIAIKTNGEDYSQTCISGVFMQIFQPLEPEDYELIERLPAKPTRDTLAQFCGAYKTEEERSLCFGEGWPLFRDDLKTAAGVQAFCTTVKDSATQTNCYRTALTIGARTSLGQPEKQMAVCSALPGALGQECFGILAEAFVEEDRTQGPAAAAICTHAGEQYSESCFGYLANLANFTFGSDTVNREKLCAVLPESMRQQCAKNNSSTTL